ncbi:MAG TPA: methionyl-tRNA formyltransferase [Vicinamibacterales bacterium]|nr:methionyl-tRNA formyltransferase [Vicinamibacterales bacterium]
MPLRVVFFGTPGFAVPTLEHLVRSPHTVVGVVTQPDRPRGRGQQVAEGPVKALAASLRLPVVQPERLARDQFESTLQEMNADIGVVAAYGKILPDWLLATPRLGLINVHASLLPKYRGASPIHRAVIAGDRETGVTIMRVVKALDAGPMLAAATVPIGPDDTTTLVESLLAARGAELLIETLTAIESGTAKETPQDESQVSYAPKLTKADGVVEWTRPANDIHNLIRGLWPWPHAYSFLDGQRYILHRSRLSPRSADHALPGSIILASAIEGLHVACGGGTAIELVDVQLEGKRVINARDALAGKTLVAGARFTAP